MEATETEKEASHARHRRRQHRRPGPPHGPTRANLPGHRGAGPRRRSSVPGPLERQRSRDLVFPRERRHRRARPSPSDRLSPDHPVRPALPDRVASCRRRNGAKTAVQAPTPCDLGPSPRRRRWRMLGRTASPDEAATESPMSMYTHLLGVARGRRGPREQGSTTPVALAEARRCRGELRTGLPSRLDPDAVPVVLALEIGYDVALIELATTDRGATGPSRFEQPQLERQRLEGELAAMGSQLAEGGTAKIPA